jgi:hypothetical protein
MCCSNPHSSLRDLLHCKQIHLNGGTSLGRPLPLLIISCAFGLRGLPGDQRGFLLVIFSELFTLILFSLFSGVDDGDVEEDKYSVELVLNTLG